MVIDTIANTTIKESSIHGRGLFAHVDIPKETVLCVLDGQVMQWDEYEEWRLLLDLPEDVRDTIFLEWNALSETTLLVRPFRTKYSFINHSRTPNLRILRFPMRVVALRDIQRGEELLLDYRDEPLRTEYLEDHGNTFL